MIKLTIAELINSAETLKKLAQQDFKAKLAWSVARLLKAAEAEMQSFNETRMNLIKKYGEKGEDGELVTDEKGNCKIEPEAAANFTNELNELIATEIEINANKIPIDLLEDVNFTPSEISILEPYIELDEE